MPRGEEVGDIMILNVAGLSEAGFSQTLRPIRSILGFTMLHSGVNDPGYKTQVVVTYS
jgi:hypothetical protein